MRKRNGYYIWSIRGIYIAESDTTASEQKFQFMNVHTRMRVQDIAQRMNTLLAGRTPTLPTVSLLVPVLV